MKNDYEFREEYLAPVPIILAEVNFGGNTYDKKDMFSVGDG